MPAGSSYHYQGTCRIGDDNNIEKDESVVDTNSKAGMLKIYMLDVMEQLTDQQHVILH